MGIWATGKAGHTHAARFWTSSGRVQERYPSLEDAEADLALRAAPASIEDVRAISIAGAAKWYALTLQARGCIPASVYNVENTLDPLVQAYGTLAMKDVGSASLLAIYGTLAAKRSPSTLGVMRQMWTMFWEHAVERGIAPRNEARLAFAPFNKHVIKSAQKRPPTDADLAAIESGCGNMVGLLTVRLASRVGAIESELIPLAWEDVDLEGGKVKFKFYTSKGVAMQQSRPERVRTISLDAQTVDLLRTWRDDPDRPDSPYVLCTPSGNRLCAHVLEYVLKRVQFGIGMDGPPKRVVATTRPRKNRRYAMDLFKARYSMGDLSAYAVVQWYREGKNYKEITALAGFSSIRALRSFRVAFEEVDSQNTTLPDIDGLLDGQGKGAE